jgi:hypothetical protein
MVGSYLLQMNLRSGRGGVGSGHRSTSAGADRDPMDHGENGRDNANRESRGPTLGPSSSATATTTYDDSCGDEGGGVGCMT